MKDYTGPVHLEIPFRGCLQNPIVEDDTIASRLLIGVEMYIQKKYPNAPHPIEMTVLELEDCIFRHSYTPQKKAKSEHLILNDSEWGKKINMDVIMCFTISFISVIISIAALILQLHK